MSDLRNNSLAPSDPTPTLHLLSYLYLALAFPFLPLSTRSPFGAAQHKKERSFNWAPYRTGKSEGGGKLYEWDILQNIHVLNPNMCCQAREYNMLCKAYYHTLREQKRKENVIKLWCRSPFYYTIFLSIAISLFVCENYYSFLASADASFAAQIHIGLHFTQWKCDKSFCWF